MRIEPEPLGASRAARLDLGAGRRVPVLGADLLDALEQALRACRRAGASAVVVEGGRAGVFAAGADLRALAGLEPLPALEFSRRGRMVMDALDRYPGVTLAAIEGRCIGGAFDLAMACDLRVADATAVFEHPGPRLGFVTGWGGTARLPRLAGPASAWILEGLGAMGANHAAAAGLIVDVVPEGGARERAEALAVQIAAAPTARIRLLKEALGRAGRSRVEARLGDLASRVGSDAAGA